MARNRKSTLKIEVVTSKKGAARSFTSVARARAYADRLAAGGKPLAIRITN